MLGDTLLQGQDCNSCIMGQCWLLYMTGDFNSFVAASNSINLPCDVHCSHFIPAMQPLGAGQLISDQSQNDFHTWHFIAVGPDMLLYMSRGSLCNTCLCEDFGTYSQCAINRVQLDGSNLQAYATGKIPSLCLFISAASDACHSHCRGIQWLCVSQVAQR